MASAIRSPTVEFIVLELRLNPDADYAIVRAKANLANVPVYPGAYWRAKRLLGLAPAVPRRRRTTRAASALAPPQGQAGRAEPAGSSSRRRRSGAAEAGDAMDDLLQHVHALRDDRDRLREALERIRDAIRDAR